MCFKFIWNNGPDRIKRKLLVKEIETFGLGMINIRIFLDIPKTDALYFPLTVYGMNVFRSQIF
jgi:hypothetical protein